MHEEAAISLPTIAILGAGSMGRAILGGLLTPRVEVTGGVRITNRRASPDRSDPEGVTAYALDQQPDGNLLAVSGANIVILAVKPAMVAEVLREVSASLAPNTIVVSAAAGVPIAVLEGLLPGTVVVARAMSNTPALIGLGVTGLSAGSRISPPQLALVRSLFETVGSVLEVPESQLDELGSISASGPAHVFYLIEQYTAAARARGFDDDQARQLVVGTFAGSVALMDSSGRSAVELRQQVTSPNGTTERAIAVLEQANLGELIDRATAASVARSKELAG